MSIHPPKQLGGHDPINYTKIPVGLADQYRKVLEEARDERPLQTFLEHNPAVLIRGLISAHITWIFPRKILPTPEGGSNIPDFLICDWNSNGPAWTLVELESPQEKVLNKKGASAMLRHAQQQVEDYRAHLRKHSAMLRDAGMPGLHRKCDAWIIIGRREQRGEKEQERIANLRESGIQVASYDRLASEVKLYEHDQSSFNAWLKGLERKP
jgi:hypothetical protein